MASQLCIRPTPYYPFWCGFTLFGHGLHTSNYLVSILLCYIFIAFWLYVVDAWYAYVHMYTTINNGTCKLLKELHWKEYKCMQYLFGNLVCCLGWLSLCVQHILSSGQEKTQWSGTQLYCMIMHCIMNQKIWCYKYVW